MDLFFRVVESDSLISYHWKVEWYECNKTLYGFNTLWFNNSYMAKELYHATQLEF